MVAEPPDDDDHDDGTSAVLGSSRRSASAFPPAPGSDRDAASSSSFVDAFRRDFWLYAVFFLLTAAQALPLTAIQHLLNRELGLEDHPETINRFFAVEFAVSTLKPAYAAVSDLCPIRGRRRVPYMVLGAAAYALALQLFARVRTTPQLYAAGVFGVACYAACESAADGVLVSVSRTNERDSLSLAREDHLEENHRSARAMRAQALGMTVRSAGSFFATATSIPLLAVVDARTAVSAAGAFAVLAAFAAARVDEPEPPRAFSTGATGASAAGCVRRVGGSTDADRSDPAAAGDERIVLPAAKAKASASAFFSRARSVAANVASTARRVTPGQRGAAAFVFAYRLPPTALVTFSAFSYARFSVSGSFRGALLFFGTFAGMCANAAYGALSSRFGLISASFVAAAFVDAACGLARLALVDAAKTTSEHDLVSGRGAVAALVFSELASTFGVMFGYMPILALAARAAPAGLEAFGFAAIVCVADAATTLGSLIAADLTEALGLGAGADRDWANLSAFAWICAVLKLAPLALLPFVVACEAEDPSRGTPLLAEEEEDRSGEDGGGGEERREGGGRDGGGERDDERLLGGGGAAR